MGLSQSKDRLLYQQVLYGNVEGIKSLRRDGAGIEWIDKEGKTPLILACMKPELVEVVKVLIDLGANVNAYRPGSQAGTPLHHAAKKGSVQTVELLLSHGAKVLMMNDDCKTALDLARAKGHWNVVRLIETRICLFGGWLRETHGPSMLETIIRQWVSKKIWAVILPCDSRNDTKHELAVYTDLKASQPNYVIQLWKVHVEEPAFNQADPTLFIVDKATKKRYKLLSENEGDKQQLQLLHNACKGITQQNSHFPAAPALIPTPTRPTPILNTPQPKTHTPATSSGAPQLVPEDVELAMAINASIQSAIAEGVPVNNARPAVGPSNPSAWGKSSETATLPAVSASVHKPPPSASIPSAPPMAEETFYSGPVHYPSIDSSPVDFTAAGEEGSSMSSPIDLTAPSPETKTGAGEDKEDSSISGLCVICLDAPAEGACIPCGHVAGCMSCLTEIKANKWGCPVCRAKIDQVIKLYAV